MRFRLHGHQPLFIKLLINSSIHYKYLYSASQNALLNPVGSNNTDLSCRRNDWEWALGNDWRTKGRLFQTKGPRTEKARVSLVRVRAKKACRIPCSTSDERRERVPRVLAVGACRAQWGRYTYRGQACHTVPVVINTHLYTKCGHFGYE